MSDSDPFDGELTPPPSGSAMGLTSPGDEAHVKLKRNLSLALDRQHEFLGAPVTPEMPVSEKRMVLEAAGATVKAALATDRTALKARQDNTLELVMLRVLFHRKRLGYELEDKYLERLKTAPRAQLEIALGPRQMMQYDQLEW